MLTTRETVDLAAFLQLGNIGKSERDEILDSIIDSLGLRHVESRRIGGDLYGQSSNGSGSAGGLGCLSGGERRRLSVGKLVPIIMY